MDGVLIANELLFKVPGIPESMLEKACWYAARRDKYGHMMEVIYPNAEDSSYMFFVMSKSSGKYKKLDEALVAQYNSLLNGERPRGITRLDSMIELAASVHRVQYSADVNRACPPCDLNPCELVCGCKGFRHIGICSHTLAWNHWLEEIDLNHLTGSIDPEKRRKGGFRHGVRPALEEEAPDKMPKRKKLK